MDKSNASCLDLTNIAFPLNSKTNCSSLKVQQLFISGDEFLAVNGQALHEMTHSEALQIFKSIKTGPIVLHVCRRFKIKNRYNRDVLNFIFSELVLLFFNYYFVSVPKR